MGRVKTIKQLTNQQFDSMFPNEDACKQYLVQRRWPEGIHCPRCGNVDVYPVTNRPFHWQCTKCAPGGGGYRFSVLVGTIFENTNKPLREWFKVIHLILTSKKGISSLQIMRVMGFGSYKTALYMCNRIRAGLSEHKPDKLAGVVELDETWVGGKDRNKHKNKRSGGRGPGSGKTGVIGAVQRKGNVVARVLGKVNAQNVREFVREAVSNKVSLLATDSWPGYADNLSQYPHAAVDHHAGEYVVGAVHTNTIEGFWSIFKRGVVGTFHKVSAKHMPLYVAEFQFRYNNRENVDIFGAAVARC